MLAQPPVVWWGGGSELTPNSSAQEVVDLLDMHIVEVVHDQSFQVFDLMSLTDRYVRAEEWRTGGRHVIGYFG